MDWGLDVEPSILRNFCRRAAMEQMPAPEDGLQLAEYPALIANPDALGVKEGRKHVLDAKNVAEFNPHAWGEPGSDDAPLLYVAQLQIQIALGRCVEAERVGILVPSIKGKPPPVPAYPITFDPETFAALNLLAEKFIRDHIKTGKPPALDASDSAAEYLRRRYPSHDAELIEATDEMRLVDAELRFWRKNRKMAEKEEIQRKHRLCELIGDGAGIKDIATWKKCKDSTAELTDWRLVAQLLGTIIGERRIETFAGPIDAGASFFEALTRWNTRVAVTRKGSRKFHLLHDDDEED
jgi:predicted phage-related endonuclease